MTEDANDQTAKSPNGPKRGRPKKTQTAEASAILALQQQIAELTARLNAAPVIDDKPGEEAQADQVPGEYYEDGKDPTTGQPRLRKRRWSRAMIDRSYPQVTFMPMTTMSVKPHGITKGGYDLTSGVPFTGPSIVEDIYKNSINAIRRQTEAYPGASPDQERAIFDAARKDQTRGRHYTPVQHVGFGWSESALAASAIGAIDPTHEPEQGFPGGYKGQPLPEKTV